MMDQKRMISWRRVLLLLLFFSGSASAQQVTLTASSGTATGEFTTLKGAFDAVNAGTHQGEVVIKINASTTETASAVLKGSGTGSASYTSVLIHPTTTNLSITGELGAPLIDLNGADNVIIDGRVNAMGDEKSLSIINGDTSSVNGSGNSTIRFINDASGNMVKYTMLKGSTKDPASGIVNFSYGITTGNDNNIIEWNDITSASNIDRPINAVYAFGGGTMNENNAIRNNNIYNYLNPSKSSYGIYIATSNSGFNITGNSFYETTDFIPTTTVVYYGIYISSSNGNGFTIADNFFGGSEPLCAGNPWIKSGSNNTYFIISVQTAGGTANNIQGNTIQNIRWTNTGNGSLYGIYIGDLSVVNIGTLKGNTIGAATGTGSLSLTAGASGANFYGILLVGTGAIDCRNNSIGSITTANVSTTPTHIYAIQYSGSATDRIDIQDNIIGSLTTPGSIHASSSSTSLSQNVYGVRATGSGSITISGNTIANLNNATSATPSGGIINGIISSGNAVNTITGNIVRDLTIANGNTSSTSSASVIGIAVNTTWSASHTVSGNMVYNLSNSFVSFAGAITGIFIKTSSTTSTVSGNFIHSLSVTGANSVSANLYGIKIESGSTWYANNIISLGGQTRTHLYGILETGSTTSNNNTLFFNTVNISGTLPSGATNRSYALYSAVNTNIRDFRNNILVNTRSTPSGSSRHYAMYIFSTGGQLHCNNNQYYVNGVGGVLGYYGANKPSLPIVSGVLGNDANSMATDPSFLSIGTSASGFAPMLPGIGYGGTIFTTDYREITRSTTAPTMGAIEVVSWTGGSGGTSWHEVANWSSGAVPGATNILTIPSGLTNYPVISAAVSCSSLALASGTSLNLNGQTLTINVHLRNNGSITGTGKVKMSGTDAQRISGTGTISHLEIANTAGVAILSGAGNMQTITTKLIPTSGTLTTNGNLTLRSDINGTARVGQGAASGGYIIGDVVTQRYLSRLTGTGRNGRAWRLVTIPVTGSSKLREVFMAGQPGADLTDLANRSVQPNDLGTVVIGHNQPDATTANNAGYDWIGVSNQVSSLRYYQQNTGGGSFASSQVPDLNTTYSDATQGYMLFARGDRRQQYNGTGNSSPTVLQATGTLKQGTINVPIPPLASAGFVLVGNPYMALLDLEKVILDNASVIGNTVYVWDANIDGNAFRQGGYRAVTRRGVNDWTATGAGANPQYIESGSAFFVIPSAGGGTLSIKESHKVDGTPGIAPHGSEMEAPSRLFINLEVTDTSSRRLVDGAVVFFDATYKYELGDPVDIAPMTNISAGSITLRQSGRRWSMEGRPWPADSMARSIALDMRNLGDDAYVLRILPTNMKREGLTAWLKDRHLSRETSLKLDDETIYSFRRTGDPSIDSSRFEIVYRITKRTNAGTLTPDDAAGEIAPRLYPNPAKGADVKLSLGSMAPGLYEVQVLDLSGRLVLKKSIEHVFSASGYSIFGKTKLSAGHYTILLIDQKNQYRETLRLVME